MATILGDGVLDLDVEWAIDVARMLRARGLVDSGSERSAVVVRLIEVLLCQPPPTNWSDVISKWQPSKTTLSRSVMDQRARRIRMLLTRAMVGINVENLKGSAQFRARLQAMNEMVTAQLLLNSGSHRSARVTYEHALRLSATYHITDCKIQATSALRRMAASMNDTALFRKLDRSLIQLRQLQTTESEAEHIEDTAITLLHRYSRNPQSIARQLLSLGVRLEALGGGSDRAEDVMITRVWYRVMLWRASAMSKPHEMLSIGNRAVLWLNEHPHIDMLVQRVEFEGSRMSAMLMLKDADGASEVWKGVREHVDAGTSNWVGLLQLYFLVCTSARRFTDARDALIEYENNKPRSGTPWREQLWMLYKAFVMLLIDEGVVPPGPYARTQRMYIGSLEASSKELVRDKPTTNASLLILKIFQLLRANKYSEVVNTSDTLRSYASRYLRYPQTARTGYFLRMLATLPASDFEPHNAFMRGKSIMVRAARLDSSLRDDAEIIPYEVLWELVLGVLQRNVEMGRRRR